MSDSSFQKRLERAQALIEITRFKEAIVELSALAASDPRNYEVLCNLSMCHYLTDVPHRALDFAKEAAAAHPGREWAFRLMSLSYSAIGLGDKALDAANECIKRAPGDPYALQALAYAQINYVMFDHAEVTAALLLKAAPDNAETHDVLGYLTMNRENYDEAERHFLRALEIDPESANTHNNLGAVYLAQSRMSLLAHPRKGRMARDSFLAALGIRPTFEAAQKNLEAAESNHNFFGGKGTGVFIRMQVIFLLTIIFSNIACRFLPNLVNIYGSYRPKGFDLGMNIILVVFLVMWTFGLIAMRRARMTFIVSTFKDKWTRAVGFAFIMLLVHILYALFFILLDIGLSDIAWLIFIALGMGLLLTALRIFGYYDAKVPD